MKTNNIALKHSIIDMKRNMTHPLSVGYVYIGRQAEISIWLVIDMNAWGLKGRTWIPDSETMTNLKGQRRLCFKRFVRHTDRYIFRMVIAYDS